MQRGAWGLAVEEARVVGSSQAAASFWDNTLANLKLPYPPATSTVNIYIDGLYLKISLG